jgi:hypothetical protein
VATVDDVALELGPASRVLVAGDETRPHQGVELHLGPACADEHRAAFVGGFVFARRRHLDPGEEPPERQRLREQAHERHAEDDRDEPVAVGNPLRQRQHSGHRERALDVAHHHHVLPAPRHAVAGQTQSADAAVDRHGAADVQRHHREENRPGFLQQQIRAQLHADEQEQADVDPERGDVPEPDVRQHA